MINIFKPVKADIIRVLNTQLICQNNDVFHNYLEFHELDIIFLEGTPLRDIHIMEPATMHQVY